MASLSRIDRVGYEPIPLQSSIQLEIVEESGESSSLEQMNRCRQFYEVLIAEHPAAVGAVLGGYSGAISHLKTF
jgi:hypothetical protein